MIKLQKPGQLELFVSCIKVEEIVNNYRGIGILNCIGKIFISILFTFIEYMKAFHNVQRPILREKLISYGTGGKVECNKIYLS